MQVLITGGRGFIGRHVERSLIKKGCGVTIFDSAMMLDVFDKEAIEEAVICSDAVIHLVGQPDMHLAQKDPHDSFVGNVCSLEAVLEAIRAGGGKQRVVVPSSAAVYGITKHLPVSEQQPTNPSQVYAWHKLMEEQLLKSYRENYGLEYVILRLFNVYGKGSKGIITTLIKKAINREKPTLYGGKQLRDWVHVEDVAEAFALAVTEQRVANRVVNVGSGVGMSVEDIAKMIEELYGLEYVFEHTTDIKYDSVADIALAEALMRWEPQIVGRGEMKAKVNEGVI